MTNSLSDKTAIAGAGWTRYSKNSGVSVLSLALEASKKAIEDAGLTVKDIDGIITYSIGDSVNTNVVATHLGLPVLHYYVDYSGGGNLACAVVTNAALAVAGNLANNVLVYRALNGSSGIRYGASAKELNDIVARSGVGSDAEGQFLYPYGATVASHYFALLCRRHMIEYGTTERQLGAVAVACRKHACLNERAQMRRPLTMEDYLNARIIAEPLRLYDCCLQTDGACAVVVTSAERAKNLKHVPVYIMGAAEGGGPYSRGVMWRNYGLDHTESYAKYITEQLFAMAGIGPQDIDVAEMYDCFTYSVLCQLEDFGFCKKGEDGSFVEGGRIELGGDLPVNTHGGLLSEGYIHGLNHVAEAVSQLRGDAGPRQVKEAEIALVCAGGAASVGSALILRR